MIPKVAEFRKIWRLAWPVIISNLSVPLLGAVDTAVVGHLPDPAFIGAVALGAMIFSFLYWGFGFLRMGTTGFTAQALGSGDLMEIRDIILRALILGFGLSLCIFMLQRPAAWVAFSVLEADPFVETLARQYFDIRIWGAPATLANYAVLGWLLGMQRPRLALLIQISMNGLNIILDFAFVSGFHMDVAGVALATVFAEYFAVILGLAIIFRIWPRPAGADLWRWGRIAERAQLIAMLRVNANIFIRTLCLIFAWALFTAKSATYGTAVLAANAVLMNFQTFLAYGLDGFAHATEALVGSAKGADDRHAFRNVVITSTILAAAVAVLYILIYLIFSKYIIWLLTDIDVVREMADSFLIWVYLSPLISVWSYQLDGIFIGTTRSREMRNGMIISLAVYLACISIFPTYFGAHGLWLSLLVFMATRALTLGFWLPRIDRALLG